MRRNIVFIVYAVSLFAIGECGLWKSFKKNVLGMSEIREQLPIVLANTNLTYYEHVPQCSESLGYTRPELLRGLHVKMAELEELERMDHLDHDNLIRFVDISIVIQLIVRSLYGIGVPIEEWGQSYQNEENYNLFYQIICAERQDLMEILSADPLPNHLLLTAPPVRPVIEYPTARDQLEGDQSKVEAESAVEADNATESRTTTTKIKTTITETTTTESDDELDRNIRRRRGSCHVDEPTSSGVTGVAPQREHLARSQRGYLTPLRPIPEDRETRSRANSSIRNMRDVKLTGRSVGSSGRLYQPSTGQDEGGSEEMDISSVDTKYRKESDERKISSHHRASSSFEKERRSTKEQSVTTEDLPEPEKPRHRSRRGKPPTSPTQSVDRSRIDISYGGSYNTASRGQSVISDVSEETSTAGTESIRSKKKSHPGSRQKLNSRTEETLKKTSHNLESSLPHSLSFKSTCSQPMSSENYPYREPLLSRSKLRRSRRVNYDADQSASVSTSAFSDIGSRKMNSKLSRFLVVPADTTITEGTSYRPADTTLTEGTSYRPDFDGRSENFLIMPVMSTYDESVYESADEKSVNNADTEAVPLLRSRSTARRSHGKENETSEISTGSRKSPEMIPTNNSQSEDEQVGSLEETESSSSDSPERIMSVSEQIEAEDSGATFHTNIKTSVPPEKVRSYESDEEESLLLRKLSKKLSELMEENKRLKSRLSRSSSSSRSSDFGHNNNDNKSEW